MRIVFIRHGEPDYEKDCLTELGLEQARMAAVRLQKENIDVVYSSTMGRALETAQAFCELTGKTVNELDFMSEIRYGKEHHDIENINMFMEAMANGSTAERIGLISVILVMYALVWPGAILLLVLVCIKD